MTFSQDKPLKWNKRRFSHYREIWQDHNFLHKTMHFAGLQRRGRKSWRFNPKTGSIFFFPVSITVISTRLFALHWITGPYTSLPYFLTMTWTSKSTHTQIIDSILSGKRSGSNKDTTFI
jgi:hypothetical protein